MQRSWKYEEIGDTLLLTDDVYEKDSIYSAKFTFLDYYGSYMLELRYKGSDVIDTLCYKGTKRNYLVINIAVYDTLGRYIKDRKEKLLSPVRVKSCAIGNKHNRTNAQHGYLAKAGQTEEQSAVNR